MTEFTDYPEALDTFANPTEFDQTNQGTNLPKHHGQESKQNDAIAALEAKVGAESSAVTTSFDYRIRQLEGAVGSPITPATGTGSPEGVVNGGLGRTYFDLTNVDAISLWVKSTSGGNTGWKQLLA